MNIILEAAKDVNKGDKLKLLGNNKVAPYKKFNKKTYPIGTAMENGLKNTKIRVHLD